MNVRYVIISNGNDVCFERFTSEDGPLEKIAQDKRLPKPFQRRLYGAENWVALHLIYEEDVTLLEGVRLILKSANSTSKLMPTLQRLLEAWSDAKSRM